MVANKKITVDLNLVVDFGNSDLKIISMVSGGEDNEPIIRKYYLANAYGRLSDGDNIDSDYYTNGASMLFDLHISEKGVDNVISDTLHKLCAGEVLDREFIARKVRPSAVAAGKSLQLTTKYALAIAIIKAVRDTIGFPYSYCDLDEVNINLGLVSLLPPNEYYENKTKTDLLSAELLKCTHIDDYVTKTKSVKLNVNIVKQHTLAEAAMAYACMAYSSDGAIKDKSMTEGYVLVIDIGEGTTDLLLILNGKTVYTSRETLKRGGRLVESLLSSKIKERLNFSPTPDRLQAAVQTGLLLRGEDFLDVASLLEEAKKEFIAGLTSELNMYFTRLELDLSNLNCFIFAGGGALPSMDNTKITTASLQTYFLERLKLDAGVTPKAVTVKDTRFANVTGAFIAGKNANYFI